jgi:SAM-dependent methyltransferase
VKILDLGCGDRKTPGAFGVDLHPFAGVDLVHDLDQTPWPLADNTYERVVAHHIIEHVRQPIALMNELHRVAKPDAEVEIVTPHFSNRCAYADPSHQRALSVRAFDFFTGSAPRPLHRRAVAANYLFEHRFTYDRLAGVAPFSLVRVELTFSRVFRWCGVAWLANRFLDFYEFYLAWLWPARDIRVTLRAAKD